MKKLVTVMVMLVASVGVAQNTTQTNVDKPVSLEGKVMRGVSVGLIKDFRDMEMKVMGTTFSDDGDQRIGFGVGFSDVAVLAPGYMGRLVYNTYGSAEGADISAIRLDANGTYGFNKQIYAFAGLNLNNLNIDSADSEVTIDSNWGMGMQLGVGAQINPNLGAQLAYGFTRNDLELSAGDILSVEAELEFSGLELSLVGTF